MKHRLAALSRQLNSVPPTNKSSRAPFPPAVQQHITSLAERLCCNNVQPLTSTNVRSFSTSPQLHARNRVQPSIRRPADFHTLLQSASSTNTLLLTLFKTSTCHSCSTITPTLEQIIMDRPVPSPGDTFGSIAFVEVELDSPERDDGGGRGWNTMYDVGIEYSVRSIPTLIGFGGRRAERVTDRLSDEKLLKDSQYMREWLDEAMKKGDPHPSQTGGLLSRIFGGGN